MTGAALTRNTEHVTSSQASSPNTSPVARRRRNKHLSVTAVTSRNNRRTAESGVFCWVRPEAISRGPAEDGGVSRVEFEFGVRQSERARDWDSRLIGATDVKCNMNASNKKYTRNFKDSHRVFLLLDYLTIIFNYIGYVGHAVA
jgi:hypothetical protein